jgi:hypothetical protein
MLPTLLRRPAPSAASLLRAASTSASPLAVSKIGSAFNVLAAPSTQASTQTASLTLVLPAGSRNETSTGVASVYKNFAFKVRLSPGSNSRLAAAGMGAARRAPFLALTSGKTGRR